MICFLIFNHKSSATRAETVPTTVLESLTCNTPIIPTNVGGILGQIEDLINSVIKIIYTNNDL